MGDGSLYCPQKKSVYSTNTHPWVRSVATRWRMLDRDLILLLHRDDLATTGSSQVSQAKRSEAWLQPGQSSDDTSREGLKEPEQNKLAE